MVIEDIENEQYEQFKQYVKSIVSPVHFADIHRMPTISGRYVQRTVKTKELETYLIRTKTGYKTQLPTIHLTCYNDYLIRAEFNGRIFTKAEKDDIEIFSLFLASVQLELAELQRLEKRRSDKS